MHPSPTHEWSILRATRFWLAILLALALIASACTDGEDDNDAADATTEEASDSDQPEEDPAGPADTEPDDPLVVSYEGAATWLDSLPDDEQLEQIRDWAQYGLAAIIGLDGDEAAGFLHDKPGIRDPFLNDATNQQRSVGRYVPDGDKLYLLVPTADPFRSRTIGLLIDDYALGSGFFPDEIEIYDYEINAQEESVYLLPTEQGSAQEVEEAHGVVHSFISSAGDIESFLADTEHLSGLWFNDDDELLIRGWDWPDTDGTNLTAEDVAVLQRSYNEGEGAGFSLDPVVGQVDDFDILAALIPEADDYVLLGGYTGWLLALGFPLDDAIDFARTEFGFDEEDLGELYESTFDNVEFGLFGTDADLRLAADQLLIEPDRTKFYALWKFIQGRPIASIARYDGGLAGTEIGMTLFYTDLVAKDWSTGVGSGVPADHGVEGFLTHTTVGTNWSYCPMGDESGRLWFGLDSGATVSWEDAIQFGSVATRLFARSDEEPADQNSTAEIERSYHFGAALRWWDDHYLDVADHEPQYLRLDQIMRWSAALAWLDSEGVALPVDRFLPSSATLRFDDWFEAREDLLEREPPNVVSLSLDINEVVAPQPSLPFERCGDTFVSGGISLPDVKGLRSLAAVEDVPRSFRRPNLISDASDFSGSGRLTSGVVDDFAEVIDLVERRVTRTATGTKVEIEAFGRQVNTFGEINATGAAGQARRFGFDLEVGDGRYQTVVSAGDELLGQFDVEAGPSGATITWSGGPGDSIRRIGNWLQRRIGGNRPADGDLLQVFDDLDEVQAVINDTAGGALLTRDQNWIRFADDAIDDNAALRVGLPGDESATPGSLYLSPIDDGPRIGGEVLAFTERTGRKQVSIRPAKRVDRAVEASLADVESIAAGRPVYQRILDDGQLATEGLDPGIRVLIREVELEPGPLPDVQIIDDVGYATAASSAVATAIATTILVVDQCESGDESCGQS